METMTAESWEGGAWGNISKTTFSYNSSDDVTGVLNKFWMDTAWTDFANVIYSYDVDGNNNEMTSQMWAGGSWMDASTTTNTYNSDDLITSSVTVNNLMSVNTGRITYTYDADNNNTETVVESWDLGTSAWINGSKMTATFNADNLVTESVQQVWDNAWVNQVKSINTYNASNLISEAISQVWNGTSWEDGTKVVQSYDANDMNTGSESFSWDGSSWELVGNAIPTYNSADLLYQMVSQVEDSAGVISNSIRMTFTYTNGVGLTEMNGVEVNIYPNPTSDFVSIELENDGYTQIILSNMEGKTVHLSTTSTSTSTIDIRELAQGVYNLNIVKNGRTISRQIVKK